MMKWWGWGDPAFTFPMAGRPNLWPWIKKTLAIAEERLQPPISRSSILLSPPLLNAPFCRAVAPSFKPEQMRTDDEERLLHCYGKSYPDLFRVRRGLIARAPDMVLLPESHEQVEELVLQAHAHEVCLIPFGGGTNIVGAVEPKARDGRMVASLDMRRMNRLLSLDPQSRTASIQAGALGPKLEKDLQARGWSLGHFPDSFEYSSLGGWLATRSAGMQSDAYGRIEEMVVSLKLVTPAGTLLTKPVPASSAGPDLKSLAVGSEGTLGVITEAVMRVHPNPAVKDYRGFLFPSFEEGVAAIQECIALDAGPSMIRLSDAGETELSFQMKAPKKGVPGLVHGLMKRYLRAKGYEKPCLMIAGFEGDRGRVRSVRSRALAVFKRYRAFALGAGVGKTWSVDKFNLPYLRDFVMDYGVMVDVSETSALWSGVVPLHRAALAAIRAKFKEDGQKGGYVGCHISHTYRTGACLYFTYAAPAHPGRELEQYYAYKRLVTDAFMRNGAALTHHHAVGYEHRPWMEDEVSPTGVKALRGLKAALDPKGILNPGKLIPEEPAAAAAAVKPPQAAGAGH